MWNRERPCSGMCLYEEQFVYVLEGRGIGYINGEPQIFEPGARFHMPAGCTHEFVNTGDVPLVHLLVASPVSIDPDSLIDKTRPLPGSSAMISSMRLWRQSAHSFWRVCTWHL